MKILIVEDDPHKLSQLVDVLTTIAEIGDIKKAFSLQQAMSSLEDARFDVVVLDMAIPSHAGDAGSTDIYSQPVGGLDVLMHLSMSGRSETVIVVTQYPTVEYNQQHVPLDKLINKLLEDEVQNVSGAILFSDDDSWKRPLIECLEMAS